MSRIPDFANIGFENTVRAEPVRIRDMTSILTDASGPTLTQFLITCPSCQRTSAVHTHQSAAGRPIVVRVVCASECAPDLAAIIDPPKARDVSVRFTHTRR